MRENWSQGLLIGLGAIATAMFGVFVYREAFPEYKIYQDDFIKLEDFHSQLTNVPAVPFKTGIKQIVLEREDKGNPIIDRCTTCHVALEIPYFSPTKIEYDVNGKIQLDKDGRPLLVPNPDYIWLKVDEKIAALTNGSDEDRKKTEQFKALKTAHVGEHEYDVTKVLRMHPLIGSETRPFEFHPVEEYGCTVCHGGNGRGIVTDRAHGPVFDGQYEIEYEGPVPQFTVPDPENDPRFSKAYNSKPGDKLLFQTTPILVGALMEANCVQCHNSSDSSLANAAMSATQTFGQIQKRLDAIQKGLKQDKETLLSLLTLQEVVKKVGYAKTSEILSQEVNNFKLSEKERDKLASQINYLAKLDAAHALEGLDKEMTELLGSAELSQKLILVTSDNKRDGQTLDKFLLDNRNDPGATGLMFEKIEAANYIQELSKHIKDTETSFTDAVTDQKAISAMASDVDDLTMHFKKGQELYLSQACFACHKIAGFARGGVGPELTREGNGYPWFIKQSIVWPQADLRISTMPNMEIDHEELEDLMTYVLAQKGRGKGMSDSEYRMLVKSWEEGRKLPWEKPITPTEMFDLNYSMTVFATEGCAACHRLRGFESNLGFSIEKGKPTWQELYDEHEWFIRTFPDDIDGPRLVSTIEKHKDELDKRIVDNVRSNSLLEEIERKHPGLIESFYTPFKYASRAKNAYYAKLIENEKDPKKKAQLEAEAKAWKERVRRILFMFAQEYGLGRLIGPRPNWSGVYRSDQWLMEHFRKPTAHVPKSIMPVFPFDDTKFYALTYMLDVLGIRHRNEVNAIWDNRGFNPQIAIRQFCVQCHGEYLQGSGPVAPWIYPVPKNLRDPEFLRNLTRERAIESIMHGVPGTPMPPWGEVGTDKKMENKYPVMTRDQVEKLVDWLFSTLPGGGGPNLEVPKWEYGPEDVIKELKKEKTKLKKDETLSVLRKNDFANAYAALEPQVYKKPEDDISEVFYVKPNPLTGPDKNLYYIRDEYYTKENLEAGKVYFEINCATCHGREGDGAGARAEVMNDAKPQDLTNLDWVTTHDDIRLLRSIKYGIPGTAMIAWGDQTNAVQRLQMVMYIRSLTRDVGKREKLMSAIYQGFDFDMQYVEKSRTEEYAKLIKMREELKVVNDEKGSSDSVEIYEKSLSLSKDVAEQEKLDGYLKDLKAAIAHEQDIYKILGLELLGKDFSNSLLESYFQDVRTHQGRYKWVDSQLMLSEDKDLKTKEEVLEKQLLESIDKHITSLSKEVQNNPSDAIKHNLEGYQKLRGQVINAFEEAKRSRLKQAQLLKEYNEMRKIQA